MRASPRAAASLFGAAVLLAACTASGSPSVSPSGSPATNPSPASSPSPAPTPPPAPNVVLAAGDIGSCDVSGDEQTAALLDHLGGTVLTLGDHAYRNGTADDFASCYDPNWGRHRDRTYPIPGNHDYRTTDAAPYFAYFGARAGRPDEGWYSFDLAGWHVIALNSNCDEIGGCGADSPQAAWLRADLDAHPVACTLAMWHHPRWSSGDDHGSDPRTDAFWRLAHDEGVDVVLSGHDHEYERFVPMNADGAAEPDGMVAFVVGTGGRSLTGFGPILPTSAAHDNSTFGVLKLTLRPHGYDWEFVPATNTAFTDTGSADCR